MSSQRPTDGPADRRTDTDQTMFEALWGLDYSPLHGMLSNSIYSKESISDY